MLILLPLVLNNQTSLKLTFEVLMRHKVFLNHIAVRGRQHAYLPLASASSGVISKNGFRLL